MVSQTARGQGNKGLNDKQKLDAYLQQAKAMRQDYTGETVKRAVTYQAGESTDEIGQQVRAAFGVGKDKPTVNLRDKADADAVSKLFKALRPATPPKFTPDPHTAKLNLPPRVFEGMHTSVLPKIDASGVPEEYNSALRDQQKAAKASSSRSSTATARPVKPPNLEKLQDRIRERQLARLTQVQRLGHNISKVGQNVNRSTASWPLLPGGFVAPLVLLLILLFILVPIHGKTRVGWLWAVITGTAGVNPNYSPPSQQSSQTGSVGSGATGSGPSSPTLTSAANITNATDSAAYYTPSYYSFSSYDYDEY